MYLKRNLHVLPTPHIQARIIGTEFIEVFSVYREKASSHNGTSAGYDKSMNMQ